MIEIIAKNRDDKSVVSNYQGNIKLDRQGQMLFIESIYSVVDNGITHSVKKTDFYYMEDILSIRGIEN